MQWGSSSALRFMVDLEPDAAASDHMFHGAAPTEEREMIIVRGLYSKMTCTCIYNGLLGSGGVAVDIGHDGAATCHRPDPTLGSVVLSRTTQS